MEKRGILTVVSGFAGSGKGTIMKELIKRHDEYALSISATTRKPRKGEEDGREYFFVDTDEFEKMIAKGGLIEYANYVGNYYGTPREYVETKLLAGKDVILEIEIQGALKVRERYPDALLIFVTPPDANTLEKRLKGRGTETEEIIAKRMERAACEAAEIPAYDYILVNDDLDTCVKQLHFLIQSEHLRTSRNMEFIGQIKRGLEENTAGKLKGE